MISPGGPDPAELIKQFDVEEQEGGLLFHLRSEIDVLVKYHSEKQLQVQAWRVGKNPAMLYPDTGILSRAPFREKLVREAGKTLVGSREKGRANILKYLRQDLGLVSMVMDHTGADGETLHSKLATSGRSLAERLVLYGSNNAEFFHTPDGDVYAGV